MRDGVVRYWSNMASLHDKNGEHLTVVVWDDSVEPGPPAIIIWNERRFLNDGPDDDGQMWSWTEI